MTRREWILCVILPLLVIPVYFAIVLAMPQSVVAAFNSENGPVELSTAAMFLAAAALAVMHLRRHKSELPYVVRGCFVLFAIAAVFIAMEEMSYGQHLFGFRSPEYFTENNYQEELNLHNLMGSKPSRGLRSLANLGFPAVCIALPICVYLISKRRAWQAGHWSFYVLPKAQLVLLVVLSNLATLPKRLPEEIISNSLQTRLGELKEFYWAATALLYVLLIYSRQDAALAETAVEEPALLELPLEGARRPARTAA